MNRAHQLALGREGNFPDALEACVERFILQPGFARRDDERAFGRVALHRPAPVALLQYGVVGAVGGGERTLQLDSQSAVDHSLLVISNRPSSISTHFAFGCVSRAAQTARARSR